MVIRYEDMEELIGKFLAGEASVDEAMLLEDWKCESVDNMAVYDRCVEIFAATGGIDVGKAPNVEQAWQRVHGETIGARNVRSLSGGLWFRVAASVVILLGVGLVVRLLVGQGNGGEMVIAAGGSEESVTLKDNTLVRVLANSTVVLEDGFGSSNRRLKLQGSAYFEVVHKEELPFVVDAGAVFIKDIGTKFSISSSPSSDTVFVSVDEGVVQLFDSVGAQVAIKANERAMYVKSNKQIITPNGSVVSGGKFVFSNASLAEVIARLTDSYKVSIALENSLLAKCSITTQFENEDIETVLTVICETLSLSFEKRADGYIIKGVRCK